MDCLRKSPCPCSGEDSSGSETSMEEITYEIAIRKKRQRQQSVSLPDTALADSGVLSGCFGMGKKVKEDDQPGTSVVLPGSKWKKRPGISLTPSDDTPSSHNEESQAEESSSRERSGSETPGFSRNLLLVPGQSPPLRDVSPTKERGPKLEQSAGFRMLQRDVVILRKKLARTDDEKEISALLKELTEKEEIISSMSGSGSGSE